MLLNEDIELVKSQVSMRDIANHYGMRVNRKGFTLCPFHNDKHPSMQVFPGYIKNDGYYCRSCGAGGTIFNFVMEYEGKTFEESVRTVASIFEIQISDGKNLSDDVRKRVMSQRIRAMIQEEESKIELHELTVISETINLFQSAMQASYPYGELFCSIGNMIPVLQFEWDERFQQYCDKR